MTVNVSSGSATHFPRENGRSLILMLVVGICLSACTTLDAREAAEDPKPRTTASSEFIFDLYEITFGTTERRTVLPGFFLGGTAAELAMVSVDETGNRRLQLYAFEGDPAWTSVLDTTLGSGVLFVDVARIDGRDRLITYERGRFSWFDPNLGTLRPLVEIEIDYNSRHDHEGSPSQPAGDPPRVDVTRDLNHDGRDDILVPDFDGFWVSIQMSDGSFTKAVKLGPPEPFLDELVGNLHEGGGTTDHPNTYRDVGLTAATLPLYLGRAHEMDYNQDGRTDLVFWNEDHFEVHQQDERGMFAAKAKHFTTDVAFDSDDVSSLASGDMTGKVLHSLTDVNGDGVGDLVVHSLEGRSIPRKRSIFEVHFGARARDGGTAFAPEVGATFQSDGSIQLGMDRHDFDGDGQVELMFTAIDRKYLTNSLFKTIAGFMGEDIWLDLAFYRMNEGRYPDKPNAIRRIQLDGPPSSSEPGSVSLDIVLRGATHESRKTQKVWPRAFNTTLLIGDVTGDGRSDLLIGDHPWILDVFVGVPGPGLFNRRPQEVAVAVPNDEEYTWLVDLNKDGKQDILMHHPSTTEPHRVTMLIAQ